MIDVFVVAAVKLYREGLAQALAQVHGMQVVATASRVTELRGTITAYPHAVLLIDALLMVGVPALAALLQANPGIRVVVLGVNETEPEIIAHAEAGVTGYVTHDSSIGELVAAIEAAARDELTCPPRITAALMRRVGALATTQQRAGPSVRLSRRELQIVNLIDQGMSNQEIAHALVITLATVKNHVHNILDKLDVRTRADAVARIRYQNDLTSGERV
jgi:two-component system, NarL family, nitrate/nitrite response regulator NarL